MLKKAILLVFLLLFILGGFYYLLRQPGVFKKSIIYDINPQENGTETKSNNNPTVQFTGYSINNLKIPWETVFLPDGNILITERVGNISVFDQNKKTTIKVRGVKHVGEGGLLGAAIHPDFQNNSWIYLYFTTETNGTLANKVYRYKLNDNALTDETLIIDGIKGSRNHDGGRIAFGPDNYLYITTGDAEDPKSAQDTKALNGKILRVNYDGTIPADNPFNNAVFSYGHRNPQGLAWDSEGTLWSTEHGPSGLDTGWDELNKIEMGKNYGWPIIKGDEEQSGMERPVLHSGKNTWAPASAVYYKGSILFGGLRGEALYEYDIQRKSLKENFKNEYGRIRNVSVNRDGMVYISTSNTDGRGKARNGDDKLIQVLVARGDTTTSSLNLPEPPSSYKIKLPKHYYQSFNNCGPATLSMVLNYYGENTTQEELGNILRPYQNPKGDNDDKSVSLDEMAGEATKRNYVAYFRANGDINKLRQFISNNIPVIVTTWLKSNEDVGHYRVITGYDDQKQLIYQDDSYQGPNRDYEYSSFLALWQPFNYQYLVLIPAEKDLSVKNILGDEVSERKNWEYALDRGIRESVMYPDNPYPIFNQSVAYYYLGEYDKTISLYERITKVLPTRMLWYQREPLEAYVKTGEYTKANKIIDSILNSGNRAFSELYVLRGDMYLAQDLKEEARTEYETAVLYNTNLQTAKERLTALN